MSRNSGQRRFVSAQLASDPKCHYCPVILNEKTATLDHLVPKSRGGSNSKQSNFALACAKCNSAKGSFTHDEFCKIVDCLLRGKQMQAKPMLPSMMPGVKRKKKKSKKVMYSEPFIPVHGERPSAWDPWDRNDDERFASPCEMKRSGGRR